MQKIIFLFLILTLMTGCSDAASNENNDSGSVQSFVGEDEPVTRAEVSKMLALSVYTPEQIDGMERNISFSDTDISMWYDRYINAVYNAKLMAGSDDNRFMPDEYLTLTQADYIIKKINKKGNFKLQYSEEDKDKPISYRIWVEAFTKAAADSVTVCNVFVYATANDCNELGDNCIICNGGLRYSRGLDLSKYRDKIINVVMKNTEIMAVVKVVDNSPTISSAEITDCTFSDISVNLDGVTRVFKVDNSDKSFENGDKVNISFLGNGEYKITLSE